MTPKKQTPADLSIKARNIVTTHPYAAAARAWMKGDPVASAFYDVLSASFPQGERFFMDSVRRYRDRAPPALQAQIAAFLAQEALHTREHLGLNRQIEAGGYDLSRIDAYLKAQYAWSRSCRPIEQLAATAALEHVTAILAHELLADPRHLEGAPADAARLWRWHAIEEIEHKGVSFDAFLAATQERSGARRWALRCYTMMVATALFFRFLWFGLADLFAQDGQRSPRIWLRWLHFAFVRPGILRRIAGRYLAYYRPGFHPWQVDDRALTQAAARNLQPA